MGNPVAPFGLRPVRDKNNRPYNAGTNLYIVPASVATSLFIGDPVALLGGANTAIYENYGPGTLPAVGPATAGDGNPLLGVVSSFFPEQATSPIFSLPSTVRGVYITDDPEAEFEIMDDGLAVLTAAAVGRNADLNLTAFTGNQGVGISGATMSTTLSATPGTTGQLHILGLVTQPNILLGANAIWRVMINNHALRQANAANV